MKIQSLSFLSQPLAAFVLCSLAACGAATDGSSSTAGPSGSVVFGPTLGTATGFAVLGASAVTCTGVSDVTGDVGVSPAISITGFNPPCTIAGTIHAGDAAAVQAHADLGSAYGGLTAAVCEHNLSGQDLGGQTLAPGVYCFDTSVGITGDLTLDGGGNTNAIWIFQMGTTITTAPNSSVVMAGGALPCNVFWQVGSSATIGTGTAFQGNLLAYSSITLTNGANIVGRAMAVNAAVTMDHNNVSLGSCSQAASLPAAAE
jgi:hypothetical protein